MHHAHDRARWRSATSRCASAADRRPRDERGYDYTVERSIAYASVPPAIAEPGTAVEIDIFGEWVAGEVAAEPLWDPAGERVKG